MQATEMAELTHFNKAGEAHMVDVGDKAVTARRAVAAVDARNAVALDEDIGLTNLPFVDQSRVADQKPVHARIMKGSAVDYQHAGMR